MCSSSKLFYISKNYYFALSLLYVPKKQNNQKRTPLKNSRASSNPQFSYLKLTWIPPQQS
jgi:hypothetical protein